MDTKLRHKVIAWILMFCLAITLIPNPGYAAKTEKKSARSEKTSAEKISPDEVSEKNVIEKKESVTTYDLGQGETMSVFHGGDVRYKDDSGKLVDYDPSLVAIANGEKTEQNESLEDYVYKNRRGDKKQYMPQLLSAGHFPAFSSLCCCFVLQKCSSTGMKRKQVKPAVKPPLYRQNAPCSSGTQVTKV